MKINKLFPPTLLLLSQAVFAAQPPTAGSQLQQIPPSPTQQRPTPTTDFQPSAAPVGTMNEGARINVSRLRITGAQAYSEADLLTETGFVANSQLSLADLRGMAAKIADYYHRNGYFVAQAYLPPQNIQDGVVTIAVIDGRYGSITLRNQSRVNDALANNLLGGLNSGDPVTSEPLETRLLLLSDLPAVQVSSTLVPGAAPGTSDLIVDLAPGNRISGSVDADNAGNRYTGEYRVGATINFNEPIGQGDVATLRAMTSGSGMDYVRASYQLQINRAKLGVAYSHLNYELQREFASLRAHGTAEVASIYGSYPLIRSRDNNLYVGLAYDAKTFQDKQDSTASVTDKEAHVWMASLYGDHRDNFGGGGVSGYSFTWSAGEIDIQTPGALVIDAATARSNGHYSKFSYSLMRSQYLTDSLSLYASINGQLASKNLDVSEKMELGGMYAVRAYPEGEAYADEGYVVNLELRKQMNRELQLVGFVDSGTVKANRNPWAAGSNRRTLSGAGVGLVWSRTNDLVVRAYYAMKLGGEDAISAPDKSGRFWIQIVKYF